MRPLAAEGWICFSSIAPMIGPVVLPPDFLALCERGWVICSGEEKHKNCRQLDADWARGLRDQCASSNTPFFMKQMSRRAPIPPDLFIRQFPRVW